MHFIKGKNGLTICLELGYLLFTIPKMIFIILYKIFVIENCWY